MCLVYGVPAISASSFEKMVALYSKCFAILLIIKGEDCIKIGCETKKMFRERYNYGYRGSTIHASDNKEEYNRELLCVIDKFPNIRWPEN